MFSFGFSLKERFYLSRTEIWLFSLTVRRLSAKQHKQVRLLQEPQVNYSHLKEGASCFIETTCIKVSLNVEDVSPQALISVVPTVLCITL